MPQHSASSSSRRFHSSLFDYDAKDCCPPVFNENPSSFIASQNPKNDPPPPPPPPPPASSSSSTQKTEHVKYSIETSESSPVICEICVETKRTTQMINNKTCDHSYCSDCVTKHVATKIQDSITVVPCPGLGCKSVFVLESCLPWLPKDLLERWDEALCKALFLKVPKCYCPFKDCSAMMLVENEKDQQTAGETDCPVCHRMFCPRCNVPWHTGVDCKKYQKLNENKRQREDRLMRKLAKEKRWRKCPKCKFYVEKRNGCFHIICRCKYHFCHACGKKWTSAHATCRGSKKNIIFQFLSSCFSFRVLYC